MSAKMPLADPPSDAELLNAWRSGDRAAGEQLFRRHEPRVSNFIGRHIADEDDAADVLQRTFLGCIETRKPYEGRSSVRTYLYAIAKNKIFTLYAERKKIRRIAEIGEMHDEEFGPEPDLFLERAEQDRLVFKAMRRIPLNMQIALELRIWEGLKGREIAEVLGISHDTVRSRLGRAKQRLTEKIKELADSPELLESVTISYGPYLEGLRAHAYKRGKDK